MSLHDEVAEMFGGYTSLSTRDAVEAGLFDEDADCGVDPSYEDEQFDNGGNDPFTPSKGADTEALMNTIAAEMERERIGREMKKAREEAEKAKKEAEAKKAKGKAKKGNK